MESNVAVVATLFVPPSDWQHMLIAARSLLAAGLSVVAGGPSTQLLKPYADAGCMCIDAETGAELVNHAWSSYRLPVLSVSDAVTLPDTFLDRALTLLEEDLRVATVSFLSNDAGLLSFPERNRPVPRSPEGHDAVSVTQKLRNRGPSRRPVPIPTANGVAVLLSASALGASGGLVTNDLPHVQAESLNYSVAEFCARTRNRGFVHLLDDTTFYARHRSPTSFPWEEVTVDDMHPKERHVLHLAYPMEVAFVNAEAKTANSPIGVAVRLAKAKVQGLRIIVDGSYLGPHEMGTQVSTLASIEALSRLDAVREVVVALTAPTPDYAKRVLTAPKVRGELFSFEHYESLGRFDVAHRMVQPDVGYSAERWRLVADRVVVTLLDLIAYRIGSYHPSYDVWSLYRNAIRTGAEQSDAVTVISDDVKHQVELERIPVDPSRLVSVPFGTEHLRGDEVAHLPDDLLARGFTSEQFILCLGADYTHKNRDLAMATVAELRRRGWPHSLVMAGATVADGSSRLSESLVVLGERGLLDRDVYILPDVATAERNWLLRHADLVLYPTSAEGFGLVPYEAARFGTPALFTSFGPLAELAPDIPVSAPDWNPLTLATSAELLLGDPDLCRAQIDACIAAGTTYTWAATAEDLVELYYRILALPPR